MSPERDVCTAKQELRRSWDPACEACMNGG